MQGDIESKTERRQVPNVTDSFPDSARQTFNNFLLYQTLKTNPTTERILSIRRAIRNRQPIKQRIELVRKKHGAKRKVQVHVENNVKNGVQVRINEGL